MMDRGLAPAPANGAALNVSTGAQGSSNTPHRGELLRAPQGEARPSNSKPTQQQLQLPQEYRNMSLRTCSRKRLRLTSHRCTVLLDNSTSMLGAAQGEATANRIRSF